MKKYNCFGVFSLVLILVLGCKSQSTTEVQMSNGPGVGSIFNSIFFLDSLGTKSDLNHFTKKIVATGMSFGGLSNVYQYSISSVSTESSYRYRKIESNGDYWYYQYFETTFSDKDTTRELFIPHWIKYPVSSAIGTSGVLLRFDTTLEVNSAQHPFRFVEYFERLSDDTLRVGSKTLLCTRVLISDTTYFDNQVWLVRFNGINWFSNELGILAKSEIITPRRRFVDSLIGYELH